MKGLIIEIIGFTTVPLRRLGTFGKDTKQSIELHRQQDSIAQQITTTNTQAGTWHGFATGLLLRFNDDGSASHLFGG